MPPKKKKDDLDAKTEKKTGKKFASGPPVAELLNEQSSKDHYLVQIKDLESRIERCVLILKLSRYCETIVVELRY